MNRKGALFHWILYGVIAGIGLFLYSAGTFSQTSAGRGPWQLEMVNSFLHQSDVDLSQLDLRARDAGWETVQQLALYGGFIEPSPCGASNMVNRWNELEKWCFPLIPENVKKLFFQVFPNPEKRPYAQFTISGTRISADGGMKTMEKKDPYFRSYTFPYSFNVNLGYAFEEYNSLFGEARLLVDSCRNQRELEKCLSLHRPAYWKFQSCDNPVAPSSGRIWTFCVESPAQSQIQQKPVRYALALDFTPTTPFSVTDITVAYADEKYKITFPRDENAEGYRIYYTDANVLDYRGKAELILLGSMYFLKYKEISVGDIIDDLTRCGSDADRQEAGKAYWCGGIITSVLEDSRLVEGKDYYFTVTALIGKEEADVAGFVAG